MRTLDIEPYLLSIEGAIYILNKPPDWPTTGRTLEDDDCIQYHVMRYHGGMVWALHQLDADTSGLCCFTTRKELVHPIKTLWSRPETYKEYIAIVQGTPGWNSITVNAPIGTNENDALGVHPDGKTACTDFQRVDSNDGYSLLRARIHSGRTHQIRIHLAHLGYPLVGEEWYRASPCRLHPRQALHAGSLTFAENNLFKQRSYSAPLSDDLINLMRKLGLEGD